MGNNPELRLPQLQETQYAELMQSLSKAIQQEEKKYGNPISFFYAQDERYTLAVLSSGQWVISSREDHKMWAVAEPFDVVCLWASMQDDEYREQKKLREKKRAKLLDGYVTDALIHGSQQLSIALGVKPLSREEISQGRTFLSEAEYQKLFKSTQKTLLDEEDAYCTKEKERLTERFLEALSRNVDWWNNRPVK